MTWLDNQAQDAVSLFWARAGEVESFPRSLERPLALALPVALIKLPRLTLHGIEQWLRRREIPGFALDCENRSVRGCLVAYGGNGLVFVDGTDPIAELRFSVAHEIAHFLVDYWLPRQQMIAQLGKNVIEMLDGFRQPSVSERIHALLIGKQLGIHVNLLERNGDNGSTALETWRVEDRADKVALALLAPPEQIIKCLDLSSPTFQQRSQTIVDCLQDKFGLPVPISHFYAMNLLQAIGKGPSWAESLRLSH